METNSAWQPCLAPCYFLFACYFLFFFLLFFFQRIQNNVKSKKVLIQNTISLGFEQQMVFELNNKKAIELETDIISVNCQTDRAASVMLITHPF